MFSFKKSKPKQNLPFPICIDMHSHILPGIDDGAQDLAASVHLVKGMMELGITSAIATPHIKSQDFPNTKETISAAHLLLTSELQKQEIDFPIAYAAEYMMDEVFFEKLRGKDPLLTFNKNHILVEFAWGIEPIFIEKMVYEILMEGYKPILAHPERYSYFHNNYKIYNRLEELGFLLQVNVLSTIGYHGLPVQKAAKYLIESDLVALLGTDLHHDAGLQAMIAGASDIGNFAGRTFNDALSF
jgi:tyrosine-protein phosphatase YwqE